MKGEGDVGKVKSYHVYILKQLREQLTTDVRPKKKKKEKEIGLVY